MFTSAILLAVALAAEPGYVVPKDLETIDKTLRDPLPEPARTALAKRFPGARIVASCNGSFTAPGATELAITLLDGPVAAAGGEGPKILRVALLSDGHLVTLPWAEGPDWSYSEGATLDETRGLFYGELKCLPGGQSKTFAKSFLDGFVKRKPAAQVDLKTLGSVCFSFDDTYNNWQCFAYRQKQRDFVRWGYQATAD